VDPETPDRGSTDTAPALVREQGLVLGLVAEALDRRELKDATTAIVTEIATTLGVERVSLGLLTSGRMGLVAISNSAEFDHKSNLVRSIEAAMDEACKQGCVVTFPSTEPSATARAHADLAHSTANAITTLPLVADKMVGAMMLEYPENRLIDPSTMAWLSRVSLLLAPILRLKVAAELPLHRRITRSASKALRMLVGPKFLTAKVLTVVAASLIASAFLIDGTARVSASAALEPSESHAVVAPVQGYIETAEKRAGDVVTKGTRLASLDLRDMQLEQAKWESELGKLGREYGAALAARNRNQQRILRSRQNQVRTQLELLEGLIQRAHLVSPIDGIVVSGDLSESFGSPVDRGQLLFEVAPLDSYRLILSVDERDVARVSPGQQGELVLAGKPDAPVEFEVVRIMPISQPEDGINAFRVEASLAAKPDWLRPGMAGAAKITTGTRTLAWIYGHKMIDAIRLRIWRMGW
jgi:multidrug resistance efflux pump